MRIAVVEKRENSGDLLKIIEDKKNSRDWEVHYYNAGSQLLSNKKIQYDVVLVDYDLPDCNGKRLLDLLSFDTEAETVLIGDFESKEFKDDIIMDNRINAIVDKKNLSELTNWLSYADAKVRLKKIVKMESGIYSEIISNTNGCVFDIKKDVTVLGISRLLTKDRIDVITKSIESTNNKAVIYFTEEVDLINTSYIGLLVSFWEKIVKERKGIMAFWINSEDKSTHKIIDTFSMDILFPCFKELDDALNYVRKAYHSKKRNNNDCIEKDDTERIKIVSCC